MRNKPEREGGWWPVIVVAAGLLTSMRPGLAEDTAKPQAEDTAKPQAADPDAPRSAAVQVRAGNHPGFGRLVFDVSAGTRYHLSRDGDHVHLAFSPKVYIGDPQFLPRNVASVSGGEAEADLVVAARTRVRSSRIGERVVVDVLDPGGAAETKPAATPMPEMPVSDLPVPPIPLDEPPPAANPSPGSGPPASGRAEPTAPASLAPVLSGLAGPPTVPPPPNPSPTAPQPDPVPAAPVPEASAPTLFGPVALAAARAMPVLAGRGAAFSVPFGADIGAAALRRGDLALVVFDQRRPVDMAALRADPVLAGASVQLLPAATLIRLRLPPGMEVVLQRNSPGAWTVAVVPGLPPLHPIRPVMLPEDVAFAGRARLLLAGDAPGQVVSLADPDTGATLLLGTQRQPGQGIAITRRTPRYLLLPTWQGVAVQPLADSLSLWAAKEGFILAGADLPMAGAAGGESEGQAEAAALTRRFDFPAMPVEALQRRMQIQVSDAAVAPARARGRKRVAAAQTMISLGLAVEAQAVLQLAAEEDPAMAASADVAGLGAVAALLADRIGEASAIDDPRLSGTDEIALWRAVRIARQQEGSPQAAAVFAATLPLAMAYPAGLRDRLLPVAIETMLAGGEAAATAAALAQQKDNPTLALARAMKLEADGDVAGALAAYGAVVQGPDRRQQALAASRAVELDLASHRIDATAAADALDSQLYNWRGDHHELALRERVATLRAGAGAWRPALALLRESLAVFPDQKAEIRAAMNTIFADLLRGSTADALAPLDLITLLDENADLLAEMQTRPPQDAGISGGALQAQLAEKLLALDLPSRAGPQLERLMRAAPEGSGRAGFGASLAALKLREGDPQGALEALSTSDPPPADPPAADPAMADPSQVAVISPSPMSPGLAEHRALLFATASAHLGERAKALAALAPLNTPAAGDLRSTILEQAGDWPAAAQALADQAARLVPAEGNLDDTQRRLLVRLASAASQAGDDALLQGLRDRESPRMASGPLADMFKLLTAARVQSATDLKRAGREMALARTLPAGMKALEPPVAAPALAR